MANLLKQTILLLKEHKKTLDDIIWFGSSEIEITNIDLKKFLNVDYDDGYGGNEIVGDLILVGKGFWLERSEYDGLEWWEYKTSFKRPKIKKNYKKCRGDGSTGEDIKSINKK